jgi:hypothetical protein
LVSPKYYILKVDPKKTNPFNQKNQLILLEIQDRLYNIPCENPVTSFVKLILLSNESGNGGTSRKVELLETTGVVSRSNSNAAQNHSPAFINFKIDSSNVNTILLSGGNQFF